MTPEAAGSRAEQTRSRLREAAVAAFAERGYHGTTTRDIAAVAGMSPAAVYVHHRSKEELLYLISRAGHEETLALLRDSVARTAKPAGQLAAAMRALARYHAEHRTSARVVNYELAALSDRHQREIRTLRRAIDAEMRALVQRGVETGAFTTAEPRLTASALLSLAIDLARWYRDGLDRSPEQIGDAYADLALRMVGARSRRRKIPE